MRVPHYSRNSFGQSRQGGNRILALPGQLPRVGIWQVINPNREIEILGIWIDFLIENTYNDGHESSTVVEDRPSTASRADRS